MLTKLLKQGLKPFKRIIQEEAYKEWLKLFDQIHAQTKYPLRLKALGFNWNIHHGDAFINQFESIFVQELYYFNTSKKQPLIIDCGANIGTSVLYFKSVYPGAVITAFEPDTKIFEILKSNISENHLKDVRLINKAVWVNNEPLFFKTDKAQSGRVTKDENAVLTESVRLKDVITEYDEIDFLKLDIEGAEVAVMKDIQHDLYRIKRIFIEYHSYINTKQSLSDLLTILENNKFRYYIQGNQINRPFENTTVESEMDLTVDIIAIRKD